MRFLQLAVVVLVDDEEEDHELPFVVVLVVVDVVDVVDEDHDDDDDATEPATIPNWSRNWRVNHKRWRRRDVSLSLVHRLDGRFVVRPGDHQELTAQKKVFLNAKKEKGNRKNRKSKQIIEKIRRGAQESKRGQQMASVAHRKSNPDHKPLLETSKSWSVWSSSSSGITLLSCTPMR